MTKPSLVRTETAAAGPEAFEQAAVSTPLDLPDPLDQLFGREDSITGSRISRTRPKTRRISSVEELQLLQAARAEDILASLSRHTKEVAAAKVRLSTSVPGTRACLKEFRAAFRLLGTPMLPHPHPPRCEALVRLILELALRTGEWQTLEWSQFDEETGTISLEGWKNKPSRTLKISTHLLDLLQCLPRTSLYVFDFSERALPTCWRNICKRSRLPKLRLSDVRYEALCRLIESDRFQSWELRALLGLSEDRSMRRLAPPQLVFRKRTQTN